MTVLESVRILLGEPEGLDDKLDAVIKLTQSRLSMRLGVKEVPSELEYIVVDVAIIRFNRIGSEGVSSHSVEGESMSFSDNDFAGYEEDIKSWLNKQKDIKKGRVRFL